MDECKPLLLGSPFWFAVFYPREPPEEPQAAAEAAEEGAAAEGTATRRRLLGSLLDALSPGGPPEEPKAGRPSRASARRFAAPPLACPLVPVSALPACLRIFHQRTRSHSSLLHRPPLSSPRHLFCSSGLLDPVLYLSDRGMARSPAHGTREA